MNEPWSGRAGDRWSRRGEHERGSTRAEEIAWRERTRSAGFREEPEDWEPEPRHAGEPRYAERRGRRHPWGSSMGALGSSGVGRGTFGLDPGGPGHAARGAFSGSFEGPYSGAGPTFPPEHAHGEHAGKGPRGYQRSDERIREEICERMTAHPWLDPSECEVQVEQGLVTLTGTVSDRRAKRFAEDCCDDVFGVEDVANQIRVSRTRAPESAEHEPSLRPRARARKARP